MLVKCKWWLLLSRLLVMQNEAGNRAAASSKVTSAAAGTSLLLSDKCAALVDVAEPPNMKQAFDASLTVAMLQAQLQALESNTGLTMIKRDQQGNAQAVTLTGWTALLGIASMVVLVIWSINYGLKQYRGMPQQAGYTLVVKGKGGR